MAHADQINVLSGGAAKSFIEPLAASFKGHTVKLEFQPMGKLTQVARRRLSGGHGGRDQRSAGAAARMNRKLDIRSGKTHCPRGHRRSRARKRAGAGYLARVEAFKKTLLAAKSVVYIDPKVGTSGKHVAEILQRLGIAEQVNAKATLGSGRLHHRAGGARRDRARHPPDQ